MNKSLLLALLLLSCSCYRVSPQIEPQINYAIQDRYIKELPSPFSPLTLFEKQTDWGKEYLIGIAFAKELDFYRAITALKRASILLADPLSLRQQEIAYTIVLCYYMAKHYQEVAATFEQSNLSQVTQETFPPFRDLLLILYDTYGHLGESTKQEHVFRILQNNYPEEATKLSLYSALSEANLPKLEELAQSDTAPHSLQESVDSYFKYKKSPTKAAVLNAILPGAGYLYLGQKQTAVTALVFNSLFIASSVYFFTQGPIAAGIVTASFEAGWYFGGIYGAKIEAKFYNERLYESKMNPLMTRERLFPIFRLTYAF